MALRINRVTLHSVCIPVDKLKVHDETFSYEPLNRGPSGGFDGPWFATVPNFAAKVEADKCSGWGMMPRIKDRDELIQSAGQLIGKSLDDVNAQTWHNDDRTERGLHMAVLCCKADYLQKPLYSMFGQKVHDTMALAEWAGMRTPEGAAKLAKEAAERGRLSLKLKGSEHVDGAGITHAVAQATGDKLELLIDPNGRWSGEQTIDIAKAIGKQPMHVLFEDPSSSSDFVELMKQVMSISDVKPVRTALEPELIEQLAAALPMAAFNVQGTLPTIAKSAAACEKYQVPFWVGSSMESGISDLAMLHMMSTLPMVTFPCEIAGYDMREHNLLNGPIPLKDGRAALTEAPGLGVEIDEAAVEKYRVEEPIVIA